MSVAAVAPLLFPAGRATSASNTATFTASADAFVDQSRPSKNFGAGSLVQTDASPTMRSYMRFDVSGLAAPVSRATLRVYAKNSRSVGFSVRGVTGSWSERAIDYSNAPVPGSVAASSGAVTAGQWVAVDVTSLVSGTGSVSLALTSTNASATAYASRESGANAPRLVVETATTTTTAPTTSTTTAPTTVTTAPTTTTTTAPTTTTTAPTAQVTGCRPTLTARQARYDLLGYLWSDGNFQNGRWGYLANSTCVADRFAIALQAAGVHANVSITSAGKKHFSLDPVASFDHTWPNRLPEDTAAGVATAEDLTFFLAAVIEGEGSTAGKVDDDPSWGNTSGLVELYSRLWIVVRPDKPAPTCGCSSDPSYWNTYVDPSAPTSTYNAYISVIRSWPYAVYGRVPQYR